MRRKTRLGKEQGTRKWSKWRYERSKGKDIRMEGFVVEFQWPC